MASASEGEDQILYDHTDVIVIISGHHKIEEKSFNGKLVLLMKQGILTLEWIPEHEIDSLNKSPDSEICDWEYLKNSPAIGYSNSSENVEFKTGAFKKLKTNVEVMEIKSYHLVKSFKSNQLTFYLKDGSTLPTFHFHNRDQDNLLLVLSQHVKFKKSSRDETLFIATDPKVDLLQKSFKELNLYDDKGDSVTKFFNDPYTATLHGFSKVTNVFKDYLFYPSSRVMSMSYTSDDMMDYLTDSIRPISSSHSVPSVPACSVNVHHQDDAGFEVITCLELPPRPVVVRSLPLTVEEWNSHLRSDGSIRKVHKLKEKIFRGGLDPSLRSEIWKYLLGYFTFKSSLKEREQKCKQCKDDYYRMKLQWKSFSLEQEDNFMAYRERKSLIEKDVGRTDRNHPFYAGDENNNIQLLSDVLMTYCMYNFDLGYVQGMSDLLSPLLYVNQNESDVFWCFVGFINRVGSNFEMSQLGMKTQLELLHVLIHHWDPVFCDYLEAHESGNLYFFFRWLLIHFKREFSFDDIMRLWEVLWTDLPCKNFHLLICLSILDPEKDMIVENDFGLTEILKHVNDMSFKINLEETLCRAEGLYRQFADCRDLPKEIRDILGIGGTVPCATETSLDSSKPLIKPKTSESKMRNVNGSFAGSKKLNPVIMTPPKSSNDRPSSPKGSLESLGSIEVLAEDVEHRYQIPFSMFP